MATFLEPQQPTRATPPPRIAGSGGIWTGAADATEILSPSWRSWQRVAKRGIDLLVAVALLVVLLPLFVIIAVAIRIDSPGPVIFRQRRVGRGGKEFMYYKFRGMVADADRRLAEIRHLSEVDGPIFKMRRDPRVTRVGRILRRSSLDELPQLWNVIRGDMSLIGPRPPLPSEVAQYAQWHHHRLLVSGGMTGLWQVSGRSDTSFEHMVRLDLEYVYRWSLWLDVCILLRTVKAVVTAAGAY